MAPSEYINYAKTFGYEIQFTGLGMGYITLGDVVLTEVKDLPEVEKTLALIGMAIMSDVLRAMPADAFQD